MTEVKSLGFPGTRLVKMNSNLVLLHLVRMYNASVTPRSLEFTVLDVMFSTQLYPMAGKKTCIMLQVCSTYLSLDKCSRQFFLMVHPVGNTHRG